MCTFTLSVESASKNSCRRKETAVASRGLLRTSAQVSNILKD